jgi:hypothetical protein
VSDQFLIFRIVALSPSRLVLCRAIRLSFSAIRPVRTAIAEPELTAGWLLPVWSAMDRPDRQMPPTAICENQRPAM